MVHARAKKAKGDEAFEKKKQKIGRKKLAPATATRAEIHARTLRVQARATPTLAAGSASLLQVTDATAALSAPTHRSFSEDMIGIRHYKEGVRKSSFESLFEALFRRCSLGPVQRLQLLIASLDGLTDTDSGVRHEATRILRTMLAENAGQPDASVAMRVLDGSRIALTHASGGVRRCGCEVVQALVSSWPGLVRRLLQPGEGGKLLNWAADVAIGHVASLPVVEALFRELLEPLYSGAAPPSTLSAGEVLALYDKIVPWLSTLWKESVELQAALFRSSETVSKALCCGKILALFSAALQAHGALSKAHTKRLRDLLLVRVPLSMRDMSSAHSEHARALALVIAEACVPISTLYDDAFRAISTFVTVSIASSQSSSLSSLVRVENLVLTVLKAQPATLATRLVDAVPALLNLVIRSAPVCSSGSLLAQVFDLAVQILLQCCAVEGYTQEALTYLGAAVDLTPRLLFASRRLPPADADRVVHATLKLLWGIFSSRHGVVRMLDLSSFEGRLHSVLFGFQRPGEGGERVAGILPDKAATMERRDGTGYPAGGCALVQMANHVMYYVTLSPGWQGM
jgi:hypothetical protein